MCFWPRWTWSESVWVGRWYAAPATTTPPPSTSPRCSPWWRITAAAEAYLLSLHTDGYTSPTPLASPSLDFILLLPFATFPSLRYCVTNQGAQNQTVCLQFDKQEGPEGGWREREKTRERHSGNISKLGLGRENSRYLIAHRPRFSECRQRK